jgi:hypothetical protein
VPYSQYALRALFSISPVKASVLMTKRFFL